MESYEKIMGLVEDVRDILDLHERTKITPKRPKKTRRQKKPRSHGPLHHTQHKSLVKKHGTHTLHNPFKNLKARKRLGPTSKRVASHPTNRTPGKFKGFWRCRCANYKCLCMAKDEEGNERKKVVRIDRGYKRKYNRKYRKWRSGKGIKKRYAKDPKWRKKRAVHGDAHHSAAGHSFGK